MQLRNRFVAIVSLGILLAGMTIHMIALAIVDRLVHQYPAINDVILSHLPRYNLFAIGETAFAIFCTFFAVYYLARQWREFPRLLTSVGIMYAFRAIFLFTLPIGAPSDALLLTERYSLYPYAAHSYFPGGHAALLFLFALSIKKTSVRFAFLVYATTFVVGSMVTRAHYTADVIAGIFIALAIHSWESRHLVEWTISEKTTS